MSLDKDYKCTDCGEVEWFTIDPEFIVPRPQRCSECNPCSLQEAIEEVVNRMHAEIVRAE